MSITDVALSTEPVAEGVAGVIDGKLVLSQGISRTLRGGIGGQFDEIPTIDLSALTSDDATKEDSEKLIKELRDACTRVGFFVVKNHGIDWNLVQNAFIGAREFFALPLDVKRKYHQSLSRSFMGYEEPYYTNVDRLKKGDLKESMTTAYEPELDQCGAGHQPGIIRRENQWPADEESPLFKPSMRAYRTACLGLMRKLTKVMGKVMGVQDDFFEKKMTYPVAGIRALYYLPQAPDDADSTGLGAHTDVQFMTMIAQDPYDVQCLEVLNAAGQWIQPKLEPETFVVNLGDMMARLTNDQYVSTVHRVRNMTGRPRYSLPFFFGLNNDELVSCLPQFVNEHAPISQDYKRPITAYEHYQFRMQRAHHKHPIATGKADLGLPRGMTRIDGVVVEGM